MIGTTILYNWLPGIIIYKNESGQGLFLFSQKKQDNLQTQEQRNDNYFQQAAYVYATIFGPQSPVPGIVKVVQLALSIPHFDIYALSDCIPKQPALAVVDPASLENKEMLLSVEIISEFPLSKLDR